MSEETEHQALAEFLKVAEGRLPALRFCKHTPNEASAGGQKMRMPYQKQNGLQGWRMVPVQALRNAQMGVKKGAWDWEFLYPNQWLPPVSLSSGWVAILRIIAWMRMLFFVCITPARGEGETKTMENKHHCHARGCERVVAPRFLMCPQHWRMVPYRLQMEVWRTYRPGQEVDKNPTEDYLEAARAAINAVAAKEMLTVQESLL